METIHFIVANLSLIGARTLERIGVVAVSAAIAILTGIFIIQNKTVAGLLAIVADTALFTMQRIVTSPGLRT